MPNFNFAELIFVKSISQSFTCYSSRKLNNVILCRKDRPEKQHGRAKSFRDFSIKVIISKPK
jgi:hypothetical protein